MIVIYSCPIIVIYFEKKKKKFCHFIGINYQNILIYKDKKMSFNLVNVNNLHGG